MRIKHFCCCGRMSVRKNLLNLWAWRRRMTAWSFTSGVTVTKPISSFSVEESVTTSSCRYPFPSYPIILGFGFFISNSVTLVSFLGCSILDHSFQMSILLRHSFWLKHWCTNSYWCQFYKWIKFPDSLVNECMILLLLRPWVKFWVEKSFCF